MTNELEARILTLLSAPRLLGQLDWSRVADMKSLVHHGEAVVAVENLCENVYDASGTFDSAWVMELEQVVIALGLDEYYRSIVRKLPRKDES